MVRLCVVGSCMMDLVARVPRHPAAGETLIGREFHTAIGGKGLNQAVAARRLGADVALIACLGQDAFGDAISEFLASEGLDTTAVVRAEGVGTGVAIPLVYDDGGNSIIAVPRANLALEAAHVRHALERLPRPDMLLVQFETSKESVLEAVAAAARARIPVLVNTAPIAPFLAALPAMPDVIVANETEAAALAPANVAGVDDQARALAKRAAHFAVVTLGERGASLALEGDIMRVPAFPVQAVDSVGAGDAFCAALAVRLAEGAGPVEAVRFANAAGALATLAPGAAPSLPRRAAVEAFLSASA